MSKCEHKRIYYWTTHDDLLCGGCCDCGTIIVGGIDSRGKSVGKQLKLKRNKKK